MDEDNKNRSSERNGLLDKECERRCQCAERDDAAKQSRDSGGEGVEVVVSMVHDATVNATSVYDDELSSLSSL